MQKAWAVLKAVLFSVVLRKEDKQKAKEKKKDISIWMQSSKE